MWYFFLVGSTSSEEASTPIPPTMQALVLTEPGAFEIPEVPTPRPDGDDVLCQSIRRLFAALTPRSSGRA